MAAKRMSPATQSAARNQREKEIASLPSQAARDSALSAYNREKNVAQARARLAADQPRRTFDYAIGRHFRALVQHVKRGAK